MADGEKQHASGDAPAHVSGSSGAAAAGAVCVGGELLVLTCPCCMFFIFELIRQNPLLFGPVGA